MREIVHLQAGQCGNQIGAKVRLTPVQKFVVFRIREFGFCMGDAVFVTRLVCVGPVGALEVPRRLPAFTSMIAAS